MSNPHDEVLPRWTLTISYRHEIGTSSRTTPIDELSEIDGIVERGPHWDTIVGITINRVGGDPTLTVEEAAKR